MRDQGYYDALSTLAVESNVSLGALGPDMLYLQKVFLQGRYAHSSLRARCIVFFPTNKQIILYITLNSWDSVGRFLDQVRPVVSPSIDIEVSCTYLSIINNLRISNLSTSLFFFENLH